MRSITLLKTIIQTPHIFGTEAERQHAKNNLQQKIKRRDRKVYRRTQTKLFDDTLLSVLTDARLKSFTTTDAMVMLKRMNHGGLLEDECRKVFLNTKENALQSEETHCCETHLYKSFESGTHQMVRHQKMQDTFS
jgi:hypothetical protein